MKLQSLEEILKELERFNSNFDRPKYLDREAIRIIETTTHKVTLKKMKEN